MDSRHDAEGHRYYNQCELSLDTIALVDEVWEHFGFPKGMYRDKALVHARKLQ